MHSADRSTTGGGLNVVIEHLVGKLCSLDRRTSTPQFVRRADEDANSVWHDALVGSFPQPDADGVDLFLGSTQNHDVRWRTIECRDRASSFFLVAVHIGYFRTQQPIGLPPDLVPRPV